MEKAAGLIIYSAQELERLGKQTKIQIDNPEDKSCIVLKGRVLWDI